MRDSLNILGGKLEPCCFTPVTGFYRDGFCHTDEHDRGLHVVCALLSDNFLQYSLTQGNDLTTPYPASGFPGLKAGDVWCLCVSRWIEAHNAGCAPCIYPRSTHIHALKHVKLDVLLRYAVTDT